jgi:hypothetical protein
MRLIKILGAAVIAAAFIGASSASATQTTGLCNENTESLSTCGSPTTTAHLVSTEPLLHSSIVDVTCASSLAKVSLLASGKPQLAHIEELTWTGCKRHSGANCEVKTPSLGSLTILKLSTTDAHVQSTGGTAVFVKCGFFIRCVYVGVPTFLLQGSPADLKIETAVEGTTEHAESWCPKTSIFLALYTSLSNVYIRSATSEPTLQSTGLCNEGSIELSCPISKLTQTVHGTATAPLLHSTFADVKCSSSLVKATVLGLGAAPNPQVAHLEELWWTGCETHSGTKCDVVTFLVGLFNISKLSATDAHVKSKGGTEVLVQCGALIDCVYAGEPTLLAEGSPADLKVSVTVKPSTAHTEEANCPLTPATFVALYTSLSNVYIRS